MAKTANLRMALAAAALLAAMETGSGSGTPSPFPTIDVVSWTNDNLKGAFKNGGKASVAGETLLLSTTKAGGSVAVFGANWAGGTTLFSAPFGLDMADTGAKAGLQVIFNATGPNDGALEADIFARSNGTGIEVSAGQFGGAPPAMQTFPGIDCVFLQVERQPDGNFGFSASPDGSIFTKVFTLPSGSLPAPMDGTIPTIVSAASHGGAQGTVIEVGAPTKTFSFGSGPVKEALDAIEFARTLEASARSHLRKGDAAAAGSDLSVSILNLDLAISRIKGSLYGTSVPGKAAVKALTVAKSLDGEASALADTNPGVARGKLAQAEALKAAALKLLRKP